MTELCSGVRLLRGMSLAEKVGTRETKRYRNRQSERQR